MSGEAHCSTPRPPSRHSRLPWKKDHSMKAFLDLPWFVHLWFVQLRFDQLWFVQLWFVQVMVGIKCIACSPLGQTFCGSRTCSRCCYPPLGQTNTSQLHSSLAGLLFPGYTIELGFYHYQWSVQKRELRVEGRQTHRRRLCCGSTGSRRGCKWRTWELRLSSFVISSFLPLFLSLSLSSQTGVL